ncbi:DUF6285 domain-containing protein [Pseudomonas sp. NY15436]|uniref:DUF6285 domain-containing protein n=1 Tax=Pseudomonas sp. NY15436 TaxID=3400359 RepID=UPI003A873C37
MHDLPRAADLLMMARTSLLEELLPHLPSAQHYTALMIANAMAIASREQQAGTALDQARHTLLDQVALDADRAPANSSELCESLRSGHLDWQLTHLSKALRDDVVARLQVANPKYLKQVEALRDTRPSNLR